MSSQNREFDPLAALFISDPTDRPRVSSDLPDPSLSAITPPAKAAPAAPAPVAAAPAPAPAPAAPPAVDPIALAKALGKAAAARVAPPAPAVPQPPAVDPVALAKSIGAAAAARAAPSAPPAAPPAPKAAPVAPKAAPVAPKVAPEAAGLDRMAPRPAKRLTAAEAMRLAVEAEAAEAARPAPAPAPAPVVRPAEARRPEPAARPTGVRSASQGVSRDDHVRKLLRACLPGVAEPQVLAVMPADRADVLRAVWKALRARFVADGQLDRAISASAVLSALDAGATLCAVHVQVGGADALVWLDLQQDIAIAAFPEARVYLAGLAG